MSFPFNPEYAYRELDKKSDAAQFLKACEKNNISKVKQYLNKGIKGDVHNNAALLHSCILNNTDIVKLLIQNGADEYCNDLEPLRLSIAWGAFDTFIYFFGKGHKVETSEADFSDTLSYAVAYSQKEIAQYILEKNIYDNDIITMAGEKAASLEHIPLVKLLINHGANYKSILDQLNNNDLQTILTWKNSQLQRDLLLEDITVNANPKKEKVLKL